jgi:hypothetical protein
MSSYIKLFSEILTSTIWQEPDSTRIVWLTMLAMADKNGEIHASIPGLASFAKVSIDATETALETFQSPDKYSRTRDNEGRRIEGIDGGWRLLNHSKYRARMNAEDRREKDKARKQKKREDEAENVDLSALVRTCPQTSANVRDVPQLSASVPQRPRLSALSAHTEAEAEADTEEKEDLVVTTTTSLRVPTDNRVPTKSSVPIELDSDASIKSESGAKKVVVGTAGISLDVFLAIAKRINVDLDYASALHADLESSGWTDSSGKRVVSPGVFLQRAWERNKARVQSATADPSKREAWHVEADIKRMQAQISKIQKDPESRNAALGMTKTKEEHRESLKSAWMAFISPLRAEMAEALPNDWETFQTRLASEKVACLGNEQALEAWESDEYQLSTLSEMFPKDVPTFERWSKDFANDPWLDPAGLTFEAIGDMKDCKEQIKRLEGELAKIVREKGK